MLPIINILIGESLWEISIYIIFINDLSELILLLCLVHRGIVSRQDKV